MKSKRLLAIASFITKNDNLIDVGCDHGYLGIYLKENNLVNNILLTDLRKNALNNAINNIKKYKLNIDTFLTDGIKNIDLNLYNTISISGMGTSTILNILSELKDNNTIDKLIIQSNNDLDVLRKEISNMNYYLSDEITVFEQGIYYVICLFKKGSKELDEETIKFGLVKEDKIGYYEFLINYYSSLLNNIPNTKKDLINKYKKDINLLNELLKKCR